jgi:hypothetical protein
MTEETLKKANNLYQQINMDNYTKNHIEEALEVGEINSIEITYNNKNGNSNRIELRGRLQGNVFEPLSIKPDAKFPGIRNMMLEALKQTTPRIFENGKLFEEL